MYGFATSRLQIVEYLEILFHKKASYVYQYCKGNIFCWKYDPFSLFFN